MSRTLFIIQNSEIEGPGILLDWAKERKFPVRIINAYENEAFPPAEDVELLVVLGAPVSVGDDLEWLKNERTWLGRIVGRETLVLGICFGAQLLAEVLGGSVYPSPVFEIGWHEVKFTSFNLAVNHATLFQWHGEEFSLPEGARVLAKSRACAHHGFQKGFVTAVTSHLEMNADLAESYIKKFWDEPWFLREGRHSPYVQEPEEMQLGLENYCNSSSKFARDFLDQWAEGVFQSETPLRLLK